MKKLTDIPHTTSRVTGD